MSDDLFKIALIIDEASPKGPINQLIRTLEATNRDFSISVMARARDNDRQNETFVPNALFKTAPIVKTVKDRAALLALRLVFSLEQKLVAKRRQYKWLTQQADFRMLPLDNPLNDAQVFDAVIWLSQSDPNHAAPQIKGDRLQISFGASPDIFEAACRNDDCADFSISITEKHRALPQVAIAGSIMSANRWRLTHANMTLKAHAFIAKLICERANQGRWVYRNTQEFEAGQSAPQTRAYIPHLRDIGAYAIKSFLGHPLKKFWEKSVRRRAPLWSISVLKDDGLTTDMSMASRIPNPKSRFLADPYVISVKGETFCFAEDFFPDEKKGKISVLKLAEQTASSPEVVLDEPFHLSFPFVFQAGEDVFMIPETSAARQIRLYKAHSFPHDWRLHKVIMDNIDAADTVAFEKEGRWYLLTNICSADRSDHQSELHLFSATDLMSDTWAPAERNPIIFDSKKARNAGFFERAGKFYRVNQVQARAQYGYAFEINEVTEISPDNYSEKCVKRVNPQISEGMMRTHHYHYNGDYTVFDHSYIERR